MKKITMSMIILCVMFVTTPVWCYTYAPPIDSIVSLGVGNPSDESEKGYLADYLGITGTAAEKAAAVDALYLYDKDNGIGAYDYKDLSGGFTPGFSWDYAIVKVDGPNDYWYLFIDDNASGLLSGGDDVLTTPIAGETLHNIFNQGDPPKGISHVSWFRTTAQVPEPLTLILLGFGLVGLAGIRRRIEK